MDIQTFLDPRMLSLGAGLILGAGLLFLLVKYVIAWLASSKQSDPQAAHRRSLTGLSWIIASTHRSNAQIVGLIMSIATLAAIALSIICAVVGITIISYKQYGSIPLTLSAALATFILALLIENASINALKTIRLANEEITKAEQAHYQQIVKQMEEQFEEDAREFAKINHQTLTKDEVKSMQLAARLKQQARKQFEKKRHGLMREQTRTARHNRRASIPFAVTSILFSATAGGLFWHTVLVALEQWQNIAIGTMFALAVSVTFVQSELLKRIKDEAIKEALQSGEMQSTMLRQQSEEMVLGMVVDSMAVTKEDPNTLQEMGATIKDELKTAIKLLTAQTTARLVTVEEVEDEVKLLPSPKEKTEAKQTKELDWIPKLEQSVIPLKYPRLCQKLDSFRSSRRVTISILSLMDALNISKKFIQYRIKSGALQVATHNNNLVRISSVIDWLQTADLSTKDTPEKTEEHLPETDKIPVLIENDMPKNEMNSNTLEQNESDQETHQHSEPESPGKNNHSQQNHYPHTLIQVQESDKLSITLAAMHINPAITDEELASLLSLRRSASARFWRLKAIEILNEEKKRNGHNGHSKEAVTTHEWPEILV